MTYAEWLRLSASQQHELRESWDTYRGEGEELAQEALRRFRAVLSGDPSVQDVSVGVNHGGLWTLAVVRRGPPKVALPQWFEGFPIKTLGPN